MYSAHERLAVVEFLNLDDYHLLLHRDPHRKIRTSKELARS